MADFEKTEAAKKTISEGWERRRATAADQGEATLEAVLTEAKGCACATGSCFCMVQSGRCEVMKIDENYMLKYLNFISIRTGCSTVVITQNEN